MLERKQTTLWTVAGGGALALIACWSWCSHRQLEHAALHDSFAEPAPTESPQVRPPPQQFEISPPPPTSKPAPTSPLMAVLDAGKPQCSSDVDCKGPRQAECIQPRCLEGQCSYDYSRCECTSPEDCEDGNACTRNHCFVPTMKCIYIPIDDCSSR